MDNMHDNRKKNWEEEREQARACGCPSCRAKYNLPPKDDHDTHAGWILLAGLVLGAVSTVLINATSRAPQTAA
jgi:hypothetical protein